MSAHGASSAGVRSLQSVDVGSIVPVTSPPRHQYQPRPPTSQKHADILRPLSNSISRLSLSAASALTTATRHLDPRMVHYVRMIPRTALLPVSRHIVVEAFPAINTQVPHEITVIYAILDVCFIPVLALASTCTSPSCWATPQTLFSSPVVSQNGIVSQDIFTILQRHSIPSTSRQSNCSHRPRRANDRCRVTHCNVRFSFGACNGLCCRRSVQKVNARRRRGRRLKPYRVMRQVRVGGTMTRVS